MDRADLRAFVENFAGNACRERGRVLRVRAASHLVPVECTVAVVIGIRQLTERRGYSITVGKPRVAPGDGGLEALLLADARELLLLGI